MSWNTIIFGGIFILSLFIFINLSKVKASKNQLDRPDRIKRFRKTNTDTNKGNIYENKDKKQ